MTILYALYVVAAWIWIQYLPGYFVSRALLPEHRGMERHALALICGFSVVPLGLFLLSVAMSSPLDDILTWSVCSAINILGATVIVPPAQWRTPDIGRRDTGLLALATLLTGMALAFFVRSIDGGDVFSTVHHCLYVIVMHTISNDPSVAIPLYDGVSDQIVHYLVHHPTAEFNGLAPLFFEQRLGNAAILAPSVAVFGSAGWYVTTVFATVTAGACTYVGARALGARVVVAALSAAVFVLGAQSFLLYFVNENVYALALVTLLAWAVIRDTWSWRWLVLVGILCGHVVSVRYPAILFWPAIAVAVLTSSGTTRQRLKRFAIGGAVAITLLLPTLYVNSIMLGSPLSHPKVLAEHANPEDGFKRVVTNELLGQEFEFRALNWPFTDGWVRTAWNPFPAMLWLLLWTGLCFGQTSVALSIAGLAALFRTDRRRLWLLLLLVVPHSVAIGLVEAMDWEQLTYATAGLAPLGMLMALGIERLVAPVTRRTGLLTAAVALALLFGGSLLLRGAEFKPDTRPLTAHWDAGPPALDPGAQAVRKQLTALSPLPRAPVFRTTFANALAGAITHVLSGRSVPELEGLPVYPSGQLAMLVGYRSQLNNTYDFALEGGPLKTHETRLRTSLGLHLVTVRIPAQHARVHVQRQNGEYGINFEPVGARSDPHDFSFWIQPWSPPVKQLRVRINGQVPSGLRILSYNGTGDEARFIVTNYPAQALDVIEVPFTVQFNDQPSDCGLFIFTYGVDPTRVETLVLSGGHDLAWTGDATGSLRIPRNLLADTVVLFTDPYCSDHVPQYGDRYGVAKGPFSADRPLVFRIDQRW